MPTDTQELALVTGDAPLALMKRADIPQIFASFESQIAPLSKIANDLAITSADQTAEIAIARTTRLSLKKLRVAVENRRKELKEGILEEGRKIDGAANKLKELIEPLEEKLAAQEKIAERLEAERKLKLAEERAEALKPFGIDPTFYALADMPAESWEQLLENSRVAFDAKKAEVARLEQERIANENARLKREAEEAVERERVKAENERLRAEAGEREKADIARAKSEERLSKERTAALSLFPWLDHQHQLGKMTEAEFEAFFQSVRRADQKMIDDAAEAERIKKAAEAERQHLQKLADDAEAYRVAQEARAAREKQEAEERAAAELRAQQEAAAAKEEAARIKANKEKAALEAEHAAAIAEVNRKAEEASRAAFVAQRKEEERRARELQAQRDAESAAIEAAKAPDREKLVKLAQSLLQLPLPDMTTESGSMTLERVEKEIAALAAYIVKKAQSM